MNGYNLLCGAIHASSGRFSDYWDFADLIYRRYSDLPYDKEAVQSRVLQDINRVSEICGPVNQRLAFERLVAEDLAHAITEINSLPAVGEINDCLSRSYTEALEILQNMGLEFADHGLFIVDKFPVPYQEMDWVAFTADYDDQEDYGIQAGIYFLKKEIIPYFCDLILAHELIHVAIMASNPYLIVRGLEEGLADLIGILYVGSILYSPNIAYNVFLHARLGNRLSQSNRLYLDYTRQAFLIYNHFGLDGIVHIIKGGRGLIKEVEEKCLLGEIESLPLPSGNWNDNLTKLSENLLLGFIPNLVVSPLAAYIAQFVAPGKNVEDIATEANTDPVSAKKALKEIQDRTYTLFIDGDRIVNSDLHLILRSQGLRYEVIHDGS